MAKDVTTSKELHELLEAALKRMHDPATGINEPWYLIEVLVHKLLHAHILRTGCPPRRLHLPRAFEAALQVARAREHGEHEKTHGKLRQRDVRELFKCQVVWDADEFRVE